jgi:23S rRNA (uracil1939-C5)-methyltransferase
MSDTVTLTIDTLAAGGDGVARNDGMVVFVPRTVPGDVVRVALTSHRSFARGVVEQIVTPSPLRVESPCVHFTRDSCGGCQLQGIAYDAQLRLKGEFVRDALARIGKRDSGPVTVVPSTSQWRYRNSLTLSLKRDRMRPNGWLIGMYVAGESKRLFALGECLLAMPAVMHGWHEVMLHGEHLPRSASLRVTLRALASGGLALTVEGGTQWKQPEIDALVDAVPAIRAVWWIRDDEARALRLDRREAAEAGASFAQVNPDVAALLRQHVVAHVDAVESDRVVDAYAGSGAISRALVRAGRSITAIELDPDASAVAGAILRNEPDSRVLTGRVEHLLPHALPAPVVILNPPRAGVDAAIPTLIAAPTSGVKRLIYISCDAATLARDIARLGTGWTLSSVQAFDMFPQTAHVETVCILDREL